MYIETIYIRSPPYHIKVVIGAASTTCALCAHAVNNKHTRDALLYVELAAHLCTFCTLFLSAFSFKTLIEMK